MTIMATRRIPQDVGYKDAVAVINLSYKAIIEDFVGNFWQMKYEDDLVYSEDDWFWVADEVGGVLCFNHDWFISGTDLLWCATHEIPFNIFDEWNER